FTAVRRDETEEFVGAGRALVALSSEAAAGERRSEIERALYRAFSHYRPVLLPPVSTPPVATAPGPLDCVGLSRGLMAGYSATEAVGFSDAAFSVLDPLATLQLTKDNCPSPELRGAIPVTGPGEFGIPTAVCLSALADGAVLAGRIGDT